MVRLILFSCVLLLCGCKTKYFEVPTVQVRNDTVTVVKESTVYVPDTFAYSIPAENSFRVSADSSFLENGFCTSSAFIDTLGMLHHDLKTKDAVIDIPYLKKEDRKDSIVTAYKEKPVPYYVEKELPWWDKVMLNTWWVIAAVAIIEGVWLACRRRK